jgi:hypothetical protein
MTVNNYTGAAIKVDNSNEFEITNCTFNTTNSESDFDPESSYVSLRYVNLYEVLNTNISNNEFNLGEYGIFAYNCFGVYSEYNNFNSLIKAIYQYNYYITNNNDITTTRHYYLMYY